jgi:hypothetical protein
MISRAALQCLGDCQKILYRIEPDFRSPSRSAVWSIAWLCNWRRDAEGGRKDKQDGKRFDRNRLNADKKCNSENQLLLRRHIRTPREAVCSR